MVLLCSIPVISSIPATKFDFALFVSKIGGTRKYLKIFQNISKYLGSLLFLNRVKIQQFGLQMANRKTLLSQYLSQRAASTWNIL
jgi:hypothetical protein